jgi:hypothetical protein
MDVVCVILCFAVIAYVVYAIKYAGDGRAHPQSGSSNAHTRVTRPEAPARRADGVSGPPTRPPQDRVDPALVSIFDDAANLGRSGSHDKALETYESILAKLSLANPPAASPAFVATVHMRVAYCLMDLDRRADAVAKFEQMKPLVRDLNEQGRSDYNFAFRNALANLKKTGAVRAMEQMPAIDARARAERLAMNGSNFAFSGASVVWAKSASFSEVLKRPIAVGTTIRVSFPDQIFEGHLARRLCLWGDEDYLECLFPTDFEAVVRGRYGRCVDVATDGEGLLVMTYTPAEKYCDSEGRKVNDLIGAASTIEVIERPDSALARTTTRSCAHSQVKEIRPDAHHEFLERFYVVCESCKAVVRKSGKCARDACDCSRHGGDYSQAQARGTG